MKELIPPMGLYLDPAIGSLTWQIVAGTLLAGAAAVRMYWNRVKSIFRRPR